MNSLMQVTVDRVLTPTGWREDQYLEIREGQIAAMCPALPEHDNVQRLRGKLLPGFIDIQVNGGGGHLFNQTPDADTLKAIANAHLAFGTTGMMPTLITDDITTMRAAADAVAQCIDEGDSSILGIHFEGPLISTDKSGAHPDEHARGATEEELSLFLRPDIGNVMVTLAPERVSDDFIRTLACHGVTVCLGHSNADSDRVLAALEAGASGFTHLFNAMSGLSARTPGMIGAALLDEQSYCSLILDNHHLHRDAAKLAIKCKSLQRLMLVTDAMAHVNCEEDTLPYFDTTITRNDEKLTMPDGTLAGSNLNMLEAVTNASEIFNISFEDAVYMASVTPSAFLNLQERGGMLEAGFAANMLLLDDENQIQQVWLNGVAQISE